MRIEYQVVSCINPVPLPPPPPLTSDPQNCPIRGVVDLYEQHGLNSVNIIYHIWVIQKS